MAGLLKSQQLSVQHQVLSRPPSYTKFRGIARSELGSPYNPISEAREVELKNTQNDNDSGVLRVSVGDSNEKDLKILVPPRVCTLRAFGKTGDGVLKAESDRTPSFFTSLAASIDHSAEFKDWEILSGRMAMIVFAAAVNVEALTGNSLFHKMDVQKICEFGGVCLASILCAAGLAWGSRAKTRVANIFSARYNEFVDTVIDQLVDGLFYEKDQ